MNTSQIEIHNTITGEIVRRDFNAAELAQLEKDLAQADKETKAKTKADKELADKRQTILDRLGLTADEFQILIG